MKYVNKKRDQKWSYFSLFWDAVQTQEGRDNTPSISLTFCHFEFSDAQPEQNLVLINLSTVYLTENSLCSLFSRSTSHVDAFLSYFFLSYLSILQPEIDQYCIIS